MTQVPVLAIGRSGILYDAVSAVARNERYRIAAIITDTAYAEYDVDIDDFQQLAKHVGAEFRNTRMISESMIADLVHNLGIRIAMSANWRFVIPSEVLRLIPSGVLNLHIGRLPDYKGNATANWAILSGEPEIFADVHFMVDELDAGNVLARRGLQLNKSIYIGDVLDWVRAQAPELFLSALNCALSDPSGFVVPGSTGGLRCYPRLAQDGNIEWTQSAAEISRLVRASSRPYPGAFSWHGEHQIKVWRASAVDCANPFLAVPGQVLTLDRASGMVDVACGAGVLRLEEIEVEGRSVAPAEAIRSVRARLQSYPQIPQIRPVGQPTIWPSPHNAKRQSTSA
jgi:methionyl-tRNA formyltransferase